MGQISNPITISGFVLNATGNKPIEYAHVYIENTSYGTVSNSSGEFELRLSSQIQFNKKKLIVSAIGFKSHSLEILDISTDQLRIVLQETDVLLEEIAVSAQADSGRIILTKAINSIRKNYPEKPHLIDAFYRELSVKDTSYTRLIEAAVRVQEGGYTKQALNGNLELFKTRIKVLELRKSDDGMEYTLGVKAMALLFGQKNDLYTTMMGNYVRFLDIKALHFMSKSYFAKDFTFYFIGRTFFDGQEVFEIEGRNTDENFLEQKQMRFYVNSSDFAIIKIECSSYNNSKMKSPKGSTDLIDGKYFSTTETHYRKINGKYYPFFIYQKRLPSNTSSFSDINGTTVSQYIECSLLVTNVYENDFEKIKWKEVSDKNGDLYTSSSKYNKKFWENYNTVIVNPLRSKASADLEKKRKLSSQFDDN